MKSLTTSADHAPRAGNGPLALLFSLLAVIFLGLALAFASAGPPAAVQAAPAKPLGQTVTGTGDLNVAQPATPVATTQASGTVTASVTETQQPAAPSATLPAATDTDVGQPVSTVGATGVVPGALGTPQFVPPVPTGASGSPIAPITQPVPSVAAPNPDVNTDTGPGTPPGAQPGTSGQGGDFPWLPVGLLALAALVGAGFVLTRTRTTPAPATSTVYRVEGSAPTATESVTTTTSTTSAAGPPVTVTTSSVSPIAGAGMVAAAGPQELHCPNCGTTNGIDENFCHDCGQDLRSTRAALATAAAAPVVEAAVDIDTLPYLETLDRVDEQLEYVLSRPRVLIGTAQGNDIVINTDFGGYSTVSPVHAELRREAEGYLLRDRDSEQGTYVNDVRAGESLLANGDTFRLGEVRFIFHVPQQGG